MGCILPFQNPTKCPKKSLLYLTHIFTHDQTIEQRKKNLFWKSCTKCVKERRHKKEKRGAAEKKSWDEERKNGKTFLDPYSSSHHESEQRKQKKTSFVWLINVTLCEEFYILSTTLRNIFFSFLSSPFYELNNCIKIYIGPIICCYIHTSAYIWRW